MTWLEGNRKLLLTGLLIVASGVGLVAGSITWDQFSDFAKWLVGFYIAGNGIEYVAKSIGKDKKK